MRRELAFIALGSNLGDRAAHLESAREAIARIPKSRLLAASAVEATAPLGAMRQPDYLNQMVAMETALTPRALLHELQQIEQAGGRVRDARWGPRTIDLDIVLFGTRSLNESDIKIPHPGLADRDFWNRELEELRATLGSSEAGQ